MPLYSASQLEDLAATIFRAAGAPEDIAQHVARSLVLSDLMGHESHGVLRIPSYLDAINGGACIPAARPQAIEETATTATVDGNWAFGQVSADFATKLAIEKARTALVSAVAIVRCNHIGRLGEYTEMAAREGMIAFMAGAVYNGPAMTPYGGAERIMGTNPISFSLPGSEAPVVADVATSAIAEGKLRLAQAKNQRVAPGTLLNKEGLPSADPNDYYGGGMLLPFGGHKGYALAVIADLLGGHVTGGLPRAIPAVSYGHFLMAANLEAFRSLPDYRAEVAIRLRQIKGARPAPGFDEVMLPGEPERRTKAQREREGLVLLEDTVARLSGVAAKLGVEMPAPSTGSA